MGTNVVITSRLCPDDDTYDGASYSDTPTPAMSSADLESLQRDEFPEARQRRAQAQALVWA